MKIFIVILCLIKILTGCQQVYRTDIDKENDIDALLKSNQKQRTAHLTGNARMLADEIADTMITVSRGHVYKSSNQEIFDRFTNYFNNVEYIRWDDLEKPIIRISEDGSFAEMIVNKIVLLKYKNENNEWEKGATLFSWTAVHKKNNGRWKIISNSSTREDLEYAEYDEYYYKGLDAFKTNDYKTYLYNLERAYYLSPDNVTILYEYAKALTANDKFEKSFDILNRLADIRFIGLNSFPSDTTFQKLRKETGYKSLLERIDKNKTPVNNSVAAFTVSEKDLIPEGIAVDNNTGKIYLSSAYKRKIISIDEKGNVKNFKSEAEDDLLSTWGMEVDEQRNQLWVLSAASSRGMKTNKTIPIDQIGKSRVYKYDLTNGKLIKIYNYDAEGEKHFFNDLTVSRSGDVFITESLTSKIYKISNGKDEIELLYNSDPMFSFLNGLALNHDESKLYVAGSEGISVLDLETLNWRLLQIPKDVCLEGIDGMSYYGNTLICQQSGHPNNSIMQYKLDESGYKVVGYKILESNNSLFDSATTGEISGDYYYYIANSQVRSAFEWGKNGPIKIKPSNELKEVVIMKVGLN